MFAQDYGFDDEASDDDGRRSPRGAGGFATRACDQVERRIAAGSEPMDFGGRRRGERAPFGGEAFGVGPKSDDGRGAALQSGELDGGQGAGGEEYIDLRDYSARVYKASGGASQASSMVDPMERLLAGGSRSSQAARERDDAELALLTGSKRKQPSSTTLAPPPVPVQQGGGCESSSSSHNKKEGKKSKKAKKKKDKKSKSKKDKKDKKEKKNKSKKGKKEKSKTKDNESSDSDDD
eukprot:TRINITY_DN32117_c0_g1_i1.p1 TRINITY_DN32117_c0_g1~~TRINITY_DN32117_c0_g1_i1.p1  ORF type:complete len:236 (-),score=81.34 TRINITY_DN32117_c0_g1_i1:111-818(-)